MKKLWIPILFGVLLFMGFVSCNKEKKLIIGTWIKYQPNDTVTVTFTSGESISVESKIYQTVGSYWFASRDTQDEAIMYVRTDDCSGVAIYHPLFDGGKLYMRINTDSCLMRSQKLSGEFEKK